MRLRAIHTMYARPNDTIVVRDLAGNRAFFRLDPLRVVRTDSAGFAWYGRVDFRNRNRFNRYVASPDVLAARLDAGHKKDSGWVPLPISRSTTRRAPNQGMRAALDELILASGYPNPGDKTTYSATRYAAWVNGAPGIRHEWCHLIAHSMGGRDRASNIVAAARTNNSEQLAIENILSAYRSENLFSVRVEAGIRNNGTGLHLGTVIRYTISIQHPHRTLAILLDARVGALQASAIHQYRLIRQIAIWMNGQCRQRMGAVTATERRQIRDYLINHDYTVHGGGYGDDEDID